MQKELKAAEENFMAEDENLIKTLYALQEFGPQTDRISVCSAADPGRDYSQRDAAARNRAFSGRRSRSNSRQNSTISPPKSKIEQQVKNISRQQAGAGKRTSPNERADTEKIKNPQPDRDPKRRRQAKDSATCRTGQRHQGTAAEVGKERKAREKIERERLEKARREREQLERYRAEQEALAVNQRREKERRTGAQR